MNPLVPVLVGAALTVGKGVNDQLNADRANRIRAVETQYSPWTHMNMSPMSFKTSDPFGTAANGAVGTSALYDQALRQGQQGNELTAIDAKTEDFLKNPNNSGGLQMPEFGSSLKSQSGLTHNDDPNILYWRDNGSSVYNQGDPVFVDSEEGRKLMAAGNGSYGGYDPSRDGIYWSPYRS